MSDRLYNKCNMIDNKDKRDECIANADDNCKLQLENIFDKFMMCYTKLDSRGECTFNITPFIRDCVIHDF